MTSEDNQIYSLKEDDGSTNWSQAASLEIAGVFGSASPAVGQGTVVAGFSSGELNAYRYENGRLVWQDALQRTSIRTSVSSLNDIDADPVIDNGQVIAVGQGGRMVALEILTGQRQWELNLAGIDTPWVAGDWIFVVTDQAKLICVYRQNGHIRWITQLPQFMKPKSKKGEIDYSGPVLAGDRLIVTGSNGAIDHGRPGQWSHPEPDDRRAPDQPAAGRRELDALRARRSRPLERVPLSPRSVRAALLSARHASSDHRHRRPSQCRQIDLVQPARRQAPGAGRRPSRRDPRSARRRGEAARARLSGDRHCGFRG